MSMLRLNCRELSSEAYQGLITSKIALSKSSLGKALIELVNLRVSQINGCGYCLEMHSRSLRGLGVPNAKIDSLAGWQVSELFDARKRAALAWADSLTHVSTTHAPDEVFEPLREHFTDAQIADLIFVVALMNALNRMAIGVRQ